MSSKEKRNILIAASILFVFSIFFAKNNDIFLRQNLTNLRWDLSQKQQPNVSGNQNTQESVLSGRLAIVFRESRPATLKIETRLKENMKSTHPGFGAAFTGSTIGLGSGFFISDGGLVLTAYHVVDKSELYYIPGNGDNLKFVAIDANENTYDLELLAFDAILDLAILQANVKEKVPKLELASKAPKLGSTILAIGNSHDQLLAARTGKVVHLGTTGPKGRFADETIELSAALAAGDSGGPVLNTKGEVIGVTSYIAYNPNHQSVSSATASFVIPITKGSTALANLLAGKNRDVAVIGFSSGSSLDYDPERASIDLGKLPGAVVDKVKKGGPADKAGLRSIQLDEFNHILAADVIVAIDGIATKTMEDVIDLLFDKQVGDKIKLSVQRQDELIELELTLGAKNEVFE